MNAAALAMTIVVLARGHGGGMAGPRVPPAGLPKTRVLRTVVAGETVHEADVH